ncbi:hypothetical protein MSIMFI_05393 [Mycobacterium simulans]|nr:hypothetical protein MSIMFI_05393 [Mycobacterium simulans]
MISQHQPMLIDPHTDHRHPQRRLIADITHRATLNRTHPLDLILQINSNTEIDITPRHDGITRKDLHRLIGLRPDKPRHQMRMTTHHLIHRAVQPIHIQPPTHRERELHRIRLPHLTMPGVGGVEQQSLLQRGQRQNIGDTVAALQLVDLGLVKPGRHDIARG